MAAERVTADRFRCALRRPPRSAVFAFGAAVLLTLVSCAGTTVAANGASSPEDLLARLLSASKSRSYAAVRDLVWEYRPYQGMDAPGADMMAWEIVVHQMKTERRDHMGDWSYSDDAMSILSGTRPMEFSPPADERFARSVSLSPEQVHYFESRGCRVWIARTRSGWRLVFWEGMNRLLR